MRIEKRRLRIKHDLLLAEYDKPYDAMLIRLKDELAAAEIRFRVEGEQGIVGKYDLLTFVFLEMAHESQFPEANDNKMRIEEEMKRNE